MGCKIYGNVCYWSVFLRKMIIYNKFIINDIEFNDNGW